jgi:hypothetical protein
MRSLKGVKRCFSHVFEGAFELDPLPVSVIPTHVEQSLGVLAHAGTLSPAVHKNREIVTRLFEHSPEIARCDLKLFLDCSAVVAVFRLPGPYHGLDSDAHSVDSEGSDNCRPLIVGRDRWEDHEWKFKQIKNRVKAKR